LGKDFFFEIMNPEDPEGPKVQCRIPGEVYEWHYKMNYVKYLNLTAARDVLLSPKLIFGGVRIFQQGGWCFVGTPSSVHLRENITVPLAPDVVYGVYLNPRLHVYEWRAEPRESPGSLFPKDWNDRYVKGLVWQSTS
jgi:hypothetical protein